MSERRYFLRTAAAGAILSAASLAAPAAAAADNGVRRARSSYPMGETIARLKQDIAAKGITFFAEVDQQSLAAAAGIDLHPSTLLMFGNPGLGSHFITADAMAGLDWPVRLLVYQDKAGQVWMAWTDFQWIGRRHGIANRDRELAMATSVVASVTSAAMRSS